MLLAAVTLVAASAGCQTRPALRVTESGEQGGRRMVVAPLNLAVQLAEGLEAAVEPVYAEIIRYLQSSGERVAVIWPEDAEGLWKAVLRKLRDSNRNELTLERAAAAFVRALAAQEDFELLVLPSLGYRQASVEEGYAHWDGVNRRISARSRSVHAGANVPAMSIHVLVLRSDGRVLFRRWSGLDLVYESDLEQGVGPSEKHLRDHVEYLREGVGRALDLYPQPGS